MTDRPLVIAGSGRSGTTWVLDALAECNGLRTVFEPFHPLAVPQAASFANGYLRDDDRHEALQDFLGRVFAGEFRSLWADFRVQPHRLKQTPYHAGWLKAQYSRLFKHLWHYRKNLRRKPVVVKFIRANLITGWMHARFNARILLVMRHPAAVIASKLKLGSPDWLNPAEFVDRYFSDPYLCEDWLNRYGRALPQRLSPIQLHAVQWCIENLIPFEKQTAGGSLVVFYEDLIRKVPSEWQKVVRYLNLASVPGDDLIRQPSQQTAVLQRNSVFDENQISKWQKAFTPNELQEIQLILELFEISHYTTGDPFPIVAN